MKNLFFFLLSIIIIISAKPRPTVLWHGMGDTCCYPFSMGAVQSSIEESIPGVYVYSVMIGSNILEDEAEGFLGNVDSQIADMCTQFSSVPQLAGGFNAVGFSQGGQFLRAYVERCNNPPVYNLITMGGQHQGVADIPDCTSVNETICQLVEEALSLGAYNPFVQETVVQAQYFHDPMDTTGYLQYNKFLTDINNEVTFNQSYKENLLKLNQLVLVQFSEDTTVVPKDSEWFGFYEDGNTGEIISYNQTRLYLEDRIGLRGLDEAGRLLFVSCPGGHMKFSLDWFQQNVVVPYLMNDVEWFIN